MNTEASQPSAQPPTQATAQVNQVCWHKELAEVNEVSQVTLGHLTEVLIPAMSHLPTSAYRT